jgi:hypothetical protein
MAMQGDEDETAIVISAAELIKLPYVVFVVPTLSEMNKSKTEYAWRRMMWTWRRNRSSVVVTEYVLFHGAVEIANVD